GSNGCFTGKRDPCKFECPICLCYMAPPIIQCKVGRSFCQHCFKLVARCPQCRAPKGYSRNFSLEKIYNMLSFSCEFSVNGCRFVAKRQSLTEHEQFCKYSQRQCPLSITQIVVGKA
ncbi:hypothetical protein NQ314_008593, partial [Rhamnusium bicolor]